MAEKILVTGATGFLGGYVTSELLRQGFFVRATGRNKNILEQMNHSHLEKCSADLSHPENCFELIKNCDAVVHCAALAAPWGKKVDFISSNIVSTKNIAQEALKQNVKRFVHISTPSIYMGMKKKLNIKENDTLPNRFLSDYAFTKYEAEKIIDSLTKIGLNSITIRPQGIFGPKDNVLLPRIIAANSKSGIPLFNGGKQLIDFTYVDNVVHAIMLCLNSPDNLIGQKYNITNNNSQEFKIFIERLFKKLELHPNFKSIPLWLAKLLAKIFELKSHLLNSNTEPILTTYAVEALSTSRTLDISKAILELKYSPIVSIEDGIDRFAQWWKNK